MVLIDLRERYSPQKSRGLIKKIDNNFHVVSLTDMNCKQTNMTSKEEERTDNIGNSSSPFQLQYFTHNEAR